MIENAYNGSLWENACGARFSGRVVYIQHCFYWSIVVKQKELVYRYYFKTLLDVFVGKIIPSMCLIHGYCVSIWPGCCGRIHLNGWICNDYLIIVQCKAGMRIPALILGVSPTLVR